MDKRKVGMYGIAADNKGECGQLVRHPWVYSVASAYLVGIPRAFVFDYMIT